MKQETTKIKYFLYARKSSESEDRQVQSIDDQINRLKKFANDFNLDIKKTYTEAKSAKKPNNRPIFDEMIERIEHGEAEGILCWAINRLSRNPIDSGKLSWLLQQGILKSIQTPDREYLPQDNVLLFNVESGMANQFILDLRKTTMRGMETKLEKGWSPNMAPLGYLNTPEKPQGEKTIIPDPVRLPLIRKMWDMMLSGSYTVRKILETANNDWGFRTRPGKRRGGSPLSYSGIYNLFTNKYYAGIIEWKGKEYHGKHEVIITLDEYDRVQEILGRKGRPKPKKYEFAFTGLIRCEECGCFYTAEEKHKFIKATGTQARYVYYRCTKKKKDIKCLQRPIKQEVLEEQIEQELAKYTILPEFRQWALDILNERNDQEIQDRNAVYESQAKALLASQKQLDNLTQMRYRDLINDEEYLAEKSKLQNEIVTLREKIEQTQSRADHWLELTEQTFDFATYARYHFIHGDLQTKKNIVTALGSNFSIRDKKIHILANEWLKPIAECYPELEREYIRLEPMKQPMNKAQIEALTSIRTRWGA